MADIVGRGEGDHSANVDGGVGSKEKAIGVHQEEIGVREPAWSVRLNHAKDAGRIAAVDAAQDVGSRQVWRKQGPIQINRSRIEEVCDVIGGNVEAPEAVIQIHSTARSGSARNVILGFSSGRSRR